MKFSNSLSVTSLAAGILALAAYSSGTAHAQVPLSADYTEKFDNIADAKAANGYPWVDNSTIPGWYAVVSGKPAPLYRVTKGGTASVTPPIWVVRQTPNECAFGSISGSKNGTALNPIIGVAFTNKTGKTIKSLNINYHGEQWAQGPGGPDKLACEYSVDAPSLTAGNWVAAPQLDFNAPLKGNATFTALNGNDPVNSADVKGVIEGLSIAPDATFWLRWTHLSIPEGNQALALDEFTLSPVTN